MSSSSSPVLPSTPLLLSAAPVVLELAVSPAVSPPVSIVENRFAFMGLLVGAVEFPASAETVLAGIVVRGLGLVCVAGGVGVGGDSGCSGCSG